MLEGMRAGVNECIAEPLRQADVDAALTRLLGQHAEASAADRSSLSSARKAASARPRRRSTWRRRWRSFRPAATLLIDLHLAYGDAAVFLGADARFSVLDALENLHRLDAEFLKSLVVPDDLRPRPARVGGSSGDPARSTCGALGSVVQLAASQYAYTVSTCRGPT